MRFSTLIIKNLLRRRLRSSFTVIGISIGIATIVALGAVVIGMTSGLEGVLKAGQADFSVVQRGVSDMSLSRVDENRAYEIEALDGVNKASGILWTFFSVEDNPYFLIWGLEKDDLTTAGLNIVSGSPFSQEYDVIIGEAASKELDKAVGDKLLLREKEFNITGIFETSSVYQSKGAATSLKKLQEMEKQEGYVTLIYVELNNDADIESISQRIEEEFPDLITIKSASELGKVDKGLELMDAASSAISLLAIIIGGIGVTNTMIMSIFERTREIGVLRAIGWRRKRILSLILGESMLLCLFSIPIGSLLGIFGVHLLSLYPAIGGILEPMFTLEVFVRAFLVASAVGIIGGLYPAYRASKLSPAEAMRYE
jgi:putative ABC transport system permease protein